jgi:hypothetical protein
MPSSSGTFHSFAQRLSHYSLNELSAAFPGLADDLIPWGSQFRLRIFPPLVTFWMFLSQVLSDGASCQEMVAKALAALWLTEGRRASANSSAYCQARRRLPEAGLQTLTEKIADQLERQAARQQLWWGRRVKIVDGSSLSMPDTEANQTLYPQPSAQKPGCGFPIMRLLVIFSLATGAISRLAHGSLQQSERALLPPLLKTLRPGEVLLADRGFCGFADIYVLMKRRVDVVVRMHASRSAGVRCLKRLGPGDRLVEWVLSNKIPPAWMNPKLWMAMPRTLSLRQISYTVPIQGFRSKQITVVTTLLDAKRFSKRAFVDLYFRRWKAELFLRDIKISLHMDILRCKKPPMIHKELYMHLIAYNLIRTLMWKAAKRHQVNVLSLSFKSSLATLRQWAPLMASLHPGSHRVSMMHRLLLDYLARHILPERPNRVQPRVRKRRPKTYPLLTSPRPLYNETLHRNRYRRKA